MMRTMRNGRTAIVTASALGLALVIAQGVQAQSAGRSPEGGSTGGSGNLRTAGPGAPPGGTTRGGGAAGLSQNPGQAGAGTGAMTLPLLLPGQVIDEQGRVLWPVAAPASPSGVAAARQGVEDAIRAVLTDRQNGRVPLQSIPSARNQIDSYRQITLEPLRTNSPADAVAVDLFLRSLDNALAGMVQAPLRAGAGGTPTPPPQPQDLRPADAPKTGGDVLKQAIERNRDETAAPDRQPRTDNAPRTRGEKSTDAAPGDRTPPPRP
jgi:hypothetical protein